MLHACREEEPRRTEVQTRAGYGVASWQTKLREKVVVYTEKVLVLGTRYYCTTSAEKQLHVAQRRLLTCSQ
jgi:hypothetical protein